MRANFVVSEIGIGLRRNLTMTIAVVVTVAISLALFGAGLLIRAQVGTMKDYWYDKVEVSVFLCGKGSEAPSCAQGPVTPQERTQIEQDLKSLPQVQAVFYESQDQAYARFKEQFKNSAIADNVTPDAMPESFRVKLKDPQQYAVVATAFQGRPGVEQVQDQRALLQPFFKALNGLQTAAIFIALVQILAAALLISNTIRVAAFSRRRETGIMRLVGASNFYIQLPFLLEGAIAGFFGALLASGALVAVKKFFVDDRLVPSFRFTAFIGWDAVWTVVPILLVTGVALSALASFVTLRKYLRV
ncbi:MAG: permease-like cell division protein FtsX [Actinomycetota bacterium]